MSKLKRHGYAERLKYMHMLEDGYSRNYIHTKFGINNQLLLTLWESYQKQGEKALTSKNKIHPSLNVKLKAIKDFEENHLSLVEIMSKYGISGSALYQWRKRYHNGGIEALSIKKRKGRPPVMGRPKKKTVEQMTELERLQKENQELKTEIALLKKVRALVEERNARLREIGRGPSKN
jgi:transposase